MLQETTQPKDRKQYHLLCQVSEMVLSVYYHLSIRVELMEIHHHHRMM